MKHDLMKKRIVCCFAGFLMCMSIIFAKSVSAYAAEATEDSITTLKAGFLPDYESYFEERLSTTKYRAANGVVYELKSIEDTNTANVVSFDPYEYTWVAPTDDNGFGQWETETTVNTDNLTLVIPATITVGDVTYTVNEINSHAFSGQSSLKQIKIPEGITAIGDNAFNSCGSLESVKIPASVNSIGERVFSNCNALASAEFATGTNLTTTGDYTFDECISLASVTLPEGIRTIGTAAFRGTAALENIDLPDSLTVIGEIAFTSVDVVDSYLTPDRHNHSALTSITLPAGLDTIGDGALTNCDKLETIAVKEGNLKYSVDDGLLYETVGEKKKLVVYPHAKNLKTITIPADVILEKYVFDSDQNLETIVFKGDDVIVPQSAFGSCDALTTVTFEGSVREIQWYAFSSCSLLDTVNFEKSVEKLDEGSFAYCTSLKQITLPAGIEYVASNSGAGQSSSMAAFEGCTALEKVNVSKYAQIGMTDGVFSYNINGINNKMFNGCTSIKAFVVDDDAEAVGYTPVEQQDYYMSKDGVLFVEVANDFDNNDVYETKLLNLMAYPQGNANTTYDIPADVDRINIYAFSDTQNLKTVTFADASEQLSSYHPRYWEEGTIAPIVSTIEKYAFANSSIESLTTNTRNWTINEYAFSYCDKLKNVTIADNASTIEGYAFSNCSALETVNISDTVTSIGSRCFMYCKALKNVNFPKGESFKVIQRDIFWDCEALETVTIPKNVTEIMDTAIYSAKNVKKVVIDNPDMELKNDSVTLSDDVPYIYETAFDGVANDCCFFVKGGSKTEQTIKSIIDNYNVQNASSPRNWIIRHDDDLVVDFYYSADDTEPIKTYYVQSGKTLADAGFVESDNQVYGGEGKIFDGWYTGKTDGVKVDGTTVITKNMSLYPHFSDDPDYDPSKIGYIRFSDGSYENEENIWNSFWYGTDPKNNACKSADGKITFDTDNNVLTFNGVNAATGYLIIDGMGSITIRLVGNNVLGCIDKLHEGVLKIDGNGTLDMTGDYSAEIAAVQVRLSVENGIDIGAESTVKLKKQDKSVGVIALPKGKLTYGGSVSTEPVFEEGSDEEKEYRGEDFGYITNDSIIFMPKGGSSTGDDDDSSIGGGSSNGGSSSAGNSSSTGGQTSQPDTVKPVTTGTKETDKTTGATYTVTETTKTGEVEVEYKPATDTKDTTVTIPATVTVGGEKATVTSIADDAFAGNTTVSTVSIPNTVEEIGDNAFKGCTGLSTVSIPASVEEIGESAFQGCTKLKKVTIPKGTKTVGKNAFSGCSGLTSVTIQTTTITEISQGAFKNCKKLTKIIITKNVSKIGKDAFSGDKKLKTITIKSTKIKSMGKNAFKNVPKNATVKLPKLNAKQKKSYKKMLKKAGFKGKFK